MRVVSNSSHVLGVLSLADRPICFSLELPWLDNLKRRSCVPSGDYTANVEHHKLLGQVARLSDVPERSGILIHSANFARELEGCIAPAMRFDKEAGVMAGLDSKKALQKIFNLISQRFTLQIRWDPEIMPPSERFH